MTNSSEQSQSGQNQVLYLVDGLWRDIGHPIFRQSNYPLMSGGLVPLIGIVCAYVCFVRLLGPRFMQSRVAYDLKWAIRVYNIALCSLNVFGTIYGAMLTRCGLDLFGCQPNTGETVDSESLMWGYIYFVTKIVDLTDTVFFILRKKHNQASNLHVFHHSSMVIFSWIFLKLAPVKGSSFHSFINGGVHALMYFYYFLATFDGMKKYLWWKRHLTDLQFVQFIAALAHSLILLRTGCNYPWPILMILAVLFDLTMIVMFSNFYYHAYLAKKSIGQKQKQERRSD